MRWNGRRVETDNAFLEERSERRAYLGAEERERRALVRHELTST
jgi:hypothetical protein